MKAKITNVTFKKEYESKFGTMYGFNVEYDGKSAYYSSKKKDQNKFVKGQEVEFTEEKRKNDKGEYLIVKPIYEGGNSNFGRQLKREQSKYSGFAVSYVKDLIIAGKLEMKDWESASKKICMFMVNLDKEIEK